MGVQFQSCRMGGGQCSEDMLHNSVHVVKNIVMYTCKLLAG